MLGVSAVRPGDDGLPGQPRGAPGQHDQARGRGSTPPWRAAPWRWRAAASALTVAVVATSITELWATDGVEHRAGRVGDDDRVAADHGQAAVGALVGHVLQAVGARVDLGADHRVAGALEERGRVGRHQVVGRGGRDAGGVGRRPRRSAWPRRVGPANATDPAAIIASAGRPTLRCCVSRGAPSTAPLWGIGGGSGVRAGCSAGCREPGGPRHPAAGVSCPPAGVGWVTTMIPNGSHR